MIHDLDQVPERTAPAVKLCGLILREALVRGQTDLRLCGGDSHNGVDVLGVQYLVNGAWSDVMKIPANPGAAVLARLRAMCDEDPAHHPQGEGTFVVRAQDIEASVTAQFRQNAAGTDDVRLQLTLAAPRADAEV
jgi:hypothetical protein